KGKFYADNDERAIFFCKGALETVKKLGWSPDIVHCHGWMTSLVPAYLKTIYKEDPTFKDAKIVYSVYPKGFTEKLDANFGQKAVMKGMDAEDTINYAAATSTALDNAAINYADGVVFAGEELDEE